MANVVSAGILLITAVYAAYRGDPELLKTLALFSAGYLFGKVMAPKT